MRLSYRYHLLYILLTIAHTALDPFLCTVCFNGNGIANDGYHSLFALTREQSHPSIEEYVAPARQLVATARACRLFAGYYSSRRSMHTPCAGCEAMPAFAPVLLPSCAVE